MIRILKRILKLITILLLTANFFLAALSPVRAENSIGQKPPLTSAELKQRADKGLTFLRSKQAGDGFLDNAGTSGWAAIAFGAAETHSENVKTGSASLLDFLKTYKPEKATDFARQILAALASGKDPRNFGGYDLITGLKNFYNEGQIGEVDLINDDIFGVLALLAAGENPDQEVVLSSAKYILDHQQKDGSFSYSAKDTGGDVDDTAAAIQALALAKGKSINLNLTLTLESAKSFLAFSQNDDGGFPYSKGDSFNDSNSASTSWAIQALIAMGEDPQSRVKQGGLNPYHFLLSLQKEDGSFSWSGDSADSLMTAFAVVALLGKSWPIVLPLTPDSGVERNSPSQTPSGSSKELSGEGTAEATPQATLANSPGQGVWRATKASGNKGSETSSKKASTTNNSKINTKATDSSNASSNNAQNKGGENLKTEDNDNQKKASPNGKTETSDLRYESKLASKKDVREPVKRGNKGFILLVFIGSLTAAVVVAFSMFSRRSGEKSK
ncbi:MAG TPA: prenyltransferase/squalene oxidase repeat-containing protein [Candidatus Subteraquimicrobiales bacterium]